MEKRELICIGCPLGCPLTVTMEGEQITVAGNTCKRGEIYAKKEVTNPTRVVSVKTKNDIPKDKIFACMKEISTVSVPAPVHIGDVVIENCAGTGVPVIATKNVEKA